MLRKILMGAAVLATSSFATFSNFPVPAAQSGEVKIVSDFTMQGDWKDLGLSAKGRFVPVQNLELYLKLPFTVVTRWEGHDADKEGMNTMLKRNAERAAYLAQKTLRKVYKKVGLYQV